MRSKINILKELVFLQFQGIYDGLEQLGLLIGVRLFDFTHCYYVRKPFGFLISSIQVSFASILR